MSTTELHDVARTEPALARDLAGWAAQAGWATTSSLRRDRVLSSVIDAIAVSVVGADEEVTRIASAYVSSLGSQGRAELVGGGPSAAPALAAFVNGASAHALDFDDVHPRVHGHPSCVLAPALLALGQERGLSGAEVLDGYVAGLGVMTALATFLTEEHYARGWHATSTLGTMATAVGAVRALGGSVDQMTRALSIGASLASGMRANFGTMTKPLHAGAAARSGLDAAFLALAGLTASSDVVESPVGVGSLFAGPASLADREPGALREQLLAAAEGAPDELSVKRYPCCGGSHLGIDAALEVRDQLDGDSPITSVRVVIPRGARTALIHDDPQTGLEAKFSLPYTVATALVDGAPTLRHFTDEAVYDARVRAVLAVLQVDEPTTGPDTAGSMYERWAEVSVTTAAGQSCTARVDHYRGIVAQESDAARLDAKFLDCVSGRLRGQEADRYLAACRGLPEAESVVGLVRWPFR